jgi:hypothetical protein
MKELDVFIRSEHCLKMTDILQKNRAGISFFESLVQGVHQEQHRKWYIHTGRVELPVPEFVLRLLVMRVVPDS